VAIINHGRIVADGDLAELRKTAETGGDASLEDVFLKLIDAPVDHDALSWL
jgi:ABC-type multidrug transport system ATPase subunit